MQTLAAVNTHHSTIIISMMVKPTNFNLPNTPSSFLQQFPYQSWFTSRGCALFKWMSLKHFLLPTAVNTRRAHKVVTIANHSSMVDQQQCTDRPAIILLLLHSVSHLSTLKEDGIKILPASHGKGMGGAYTTSAIAKGSTVENTLENFSPSEMLRLGIWITRGQVEK